MDSKHEGILTDFSKLLDTLEDMIKWANPREQENKTEQPCIDISSIILNNKVKRIIQYLEKTKYKQTLNNELQNQSHTAT